MIKYEIDNDRLVHAGCPEYQRGALPLVVKVLTPMLIPKDVCKVARMDLVQSFECALCGKTWSVTDDPLAGLPVFPYCGLELKATAPKTIDWPQMQAFLNEMKERQREFGDSRFLLIVDEFLLSHLRNEYQEWGRPMSSPLITEIDLLRVEFEFIQAKPSEPHVHDDDQPPPMGAEW